HARRAPGACPRPPGRRPAPPRLIGLGTRQDTVSRSAGAGYNGRPYADTLAAGARNGSAANASPIAHAGSARQARRTRMSGWRMAGALVLAALIAGCAPAAAPGGSPGSAPPAAATGAPAAPT